VTTDDRRAEIDRRFDETFAVFDERMRKEQEAVSQERASRGTGPGAGGEGGSDDAGSSAGSGEDDGAPGEGPEAGGGEEAQSGTDGAGPGGGRGESGDGQSGTEGGGGGYGGGAKGGSGPNSIPADIPDGRDDDIVARQLREAAMKETDPELREKLWEEYRQYKRSTQ
jgi:hypothetical protein